MPSTDSGCLCVDQGPSTQGQLTFNETGQTHVQEQIFIEETGILGNESIKLYQWAPSIRDTRTSTQQLHGVGLPGVGGRGSLEHQPHLPAV